MQLGRTSWPEKGKKGKRALWAENRGMGHLSPFCPFCPFLARAPFLYSFSMSPQNFSSIGAIFAKWFVNYFNMGTDSPRRGRKVSQWFIFVENGFRLFLRQFSTNLAEFWIWCRNYIREESLSRFFRKFDKIFPNFPSFPQNFPENYL